MEWKGFLKMTENCHKRNGNVKKTLMNSAKSTNSKKE
nr:MAG TPA: hypothetical protein [Caudoviricetes sp.]